jgi:hypothetical protein
MMEKQTAEQLIQQLDNLAEQHKLGEVAFVCWWGLIYSWQKYKLENLKLFLEKKDFPPEGFIVLEETPDEPLTLHVELKLLPDYAASADDPEEHEVERMSDMILRIDDVYEMWDGGGRYEQDFIETNFQEESSRAVLAGHQDLFD